MWVEIQHISRERSNDNCRVCSVVATNLVLSVRTMQSISLTSLQAWQKEQNITFNLDGGESAPLQERGSLVGEQVDCDLQDVVGSGQTCLTYLCCCLQDLPHHHLVVFIKILLFMTLVVVLNMIFCILMA